MFKNLRFALVVLMSVFSLASWAQPKVFVIHNAADPAAAEVDVYYNGNELLDNFGFRQNSGWVEAVAGPALIEIKDKDGNNNLFDFTANLTDGENYILMANGVATPANFDNQTNSDIGAKIVAFTGGREFASGTQKVAVNVIHGVTDAPPVDIVIRDLEGGMIKNVAFQAESGYIEIDPGSYLIDVYPAGSDELLATYGAPLSTAAGGAAIVYASGFLDPASNQDGEAFGLFAAFQPFDGPVGNAIALPAITTADLQVIHNSADAAASSVDIFINNVKTELQGVEYKQASEFVTLPANEDIEIGVGAAGATSPIQNFPFNLMPGESYIAVASGVLDDTKFEENPDDLSIAFDIIAFDGALQEAEEDGKVSFNVMHGSTDAPTVDISIRGTELKFEGVAYGDVSDYITVDPGEYVVDIAAAGTNNVVASFDVDLSGLANGSATVLATGFFNADAENQMDNPFGLIGVLADATVVSFETLVGQEEISILSQEALLFPNPVQESLNISYEPAISGVVNLQIINSQGQLVWKQRRSVVAGAVQQEQLNTGNLQPGAYRIQILGNNAQWSAGFLKQ